VVVQSGISRATLIKERINPTQKYLSMTITMLRRRNTNLWRQVQEKPQCSEFLLSNRGYSFKVKRKYILPYQALDRNMGKKDGSSLVDVSLYG